MVRGQLPSRRQRAPVPSMTRGRRTAVRLPTQSSRRPVLTASLAYGHAEMQKTIAPSLARGLVQLATRVLALSGLVRPITADAVADRLR